MLKRKEEFLALLSTYHFLFLNTNKLVASAATAVNAYPNTLVLAPVSIAFFLEAVSFFASFFVSAGFTWFFLSSGLFISSEGLTSSAVNLSYLAYKVRSSDNTYSGLAGVFDTPTAKARWVLTYANFQIYSRAYKTNLFL